MWDRKDISQERHWYYQQLAQKCIAAFAKSTVPAQYVDNHEEALSKLLSLIPEGASVGFGDSVTLFQIGIDDALEKRNKNKLVNPFRKDGKDIFPTDINVARRALTADIFLTGVNAVTLDGKLVSIDGRGNRVAGLIFGSERAIVVAGANKIVANVDEALKRIKHVAAPLNAKRHLLKHGFENPPPCALTGVCVDCRHPKRICNFTVIVEGQMRPRLEVLLVGEELGI